MYANSQLPDCTYLVKIILLSACREFDGKDQRREVTGGKKMEEGKGKPTVGSLLKLKFTLQECHFLTFRSVFLFAAKSMMPKRTTLYAILVSYQSIEEKANKISFMLIFRDKPYRTTESWGGGRGEIEVSPEDI